MYTRSLKLDLDSFLVMSITSLNRNTQRSLNFLPQPRLFFFEKKKKKKKKKIAKNQVSLFLVAPELDRALADELTTRVVEQLVGLGLQLVEHRLHRHDCVALFSEQTRHQQNQTRPQRNNRNKKKERKKEKKKKKKKKKKKRRKNM
jgi:hypothetical protein